MLQPSCEGFEKSFCRHFLIALSHPLDKASVPDSEVKMVVLTSVVNMIARCKQQVILFPVPVPSRIDKHWCLPLQSLKIYQPNQPPLNILDTSTDLAVHVVFYTIRNTNHFHCQLFHKPKHRCRTDIYRTLPGRSTPHPLESRVVWNQYDSLRPQTVRTTAPGIGTAPHFPECDRISRGGR